MSSYLSFYVVPKRKTEEEEKKHLILCSYSRNSEMYQRFYECLNIAYVGNNDKYTSLNKESVEVVLANFKEDIDKATKRLTEYEKYAKDNPDYIQEIIELKEYIEDLQYWYNKTTFIQDIVEESNTYNEGIEEVCCNID